MNRAFISFWDAALGGALRRLCGYEVLGAQHVPRGPAIIASNHLGVLDPPSTLIAARTLVPPRHIYYLAKRSLYEERFLGIPWVAYMLHQIDAIPLTPQGADLNAFKQALQRLAEGRLVGIFPEGGITWTHAPKPALPGLALLAHLSQAPVVPLGITGTRPLWWRDDRGRLRFNRVRLRFGAPIAPPPRGRMSEGARQAYSQGVMDSCYALVHATLSSGDDRSAR